MACCVPFCDSAIPYKKGDKRKSGLSFHQFPADFDLKMKWIMAIGRKDPKTGKYWNPHSSAVVCSLHFSPKQFKINSRKAVLKHGSIPFIFPDHHLPQCGTLIKTVDLSSVISTASNNQEDSINSEPLNLLQISSVDDASPKTNESNDTNKIKQTFSQFMPEVPSNVDLAAESCSSNPKISVDSPFNKSSLSAIQDIKGNSNKNCVKENNALTFLVQDINTDTSIANVMQNFILNPWENLTEIDKSLLTKFDSEMREKQRLISELLKLKEENENIQFMNRIMSEKLKVFRIEELKTGVAHGMSKALFLYDQLCNLAKERLVWSESTMNFSNSLEEKLPESYKFLRQTGIISLPSPKNYSDQYEIDICHR